MEVISGPLFMAFPCADASRVGEARRHAARLTDEMGWDAVDAGRAALVVTELATNLLRHAHDGRLLLGCYAERGELEVLSIDQGPGIADADRCLRDGFSTGGTQGTGLGAARRLSQQFEIHSSVPQGTVVLARLRHNGAPGRAAAGIDIRGISLAVPGEQACGDAWSAGVGAAHATLMVADGLGHGPDASKAAQVAMDVFRRAPGADLRAGLQQAHSEMRSTRGAAVCSLALDAAAGKLHGAGAGNIATRIVSGVSDRTMLSQHGTVGIQMRSLQEVAMEWPAHAMVVVHSDGIETRWPPQLIAPLLGRDPALAAAVLLRDHCRGRDDATVVVARRQE